MKNNKYYQFDSKELGKSYRFKRVKTNDIIKYICITVYGKHIWYKWCLEWFIENLKRGKDNE